jgi:hypothetical protein
MISLLLWFGHALAINPSIPAEETIWNQVVWIQSPGLERGEIITGFCNATLISGQYLVTAAHCVHHAYVMRYYEISIQFGQYVYRKEKDNVVRRVGYRSQSPKTYQAQYYFLPSLKRQFDSNGYRAKIEPSVDIALVKLHKPVDQMHHLNFGSIKLMSPRLQRQLGNNWVSYWPTVVSVNYLETISHSDSRQKSQLDQIKVFTNHLESQSRSRLTPGDSGAPLFIRSGSEWFLAAITKGRAETLFTNWDVFTITGQNLCKLLNLASPESSDIHSNACEL